MKRKPTYTIGELAKILNVNPKTLDRRVHTSEEKPVAVVAEPSSGFGDLLKGGKHRYNKRYEKDSFLCWHSRNWVQTERARKATSQTVTEKLSEKTNVVV
jgi:hypothetical protein